ncbi:NADH-quinone oxidoreductase subunit NuoN [Propionivibrio limicola]|uniref:NADH-quinone oxidoreductase subunit NuoN n=1 Tax=Propionivibrio limicola TaxID=167645 RepID=UPI001291240A|nr:NADH-quinone oxidoreductase subunit NuoN [Propionivibrio limicola]
MQFVVPDLRLASAEIVVLAMACLVLIVDVFVQDKKRTLTFALIQVSLLGAAVATLLTSSGQILYTFNNMYVGDLMGDLLKLCVYVTVSVVLFYSRGYVNDRPQLARGEFYVLTLFATLGMMVMISANHFLTVYIGIELLSLSLYAMVALNRDSVTSTEAAMKYFVLGALASGLLLYGMSMIYGATGTLEITAVAEQAFNGQINRTILAFGLVFLVSGVAFKLGVVPFHMWIPDVYQGAPTAVTLFIASAPKLAAFAIMVRMLVNGLLIASADWQIMFLILSVLSMALGNFAAISQSNIKRMLAYSAISHMGFMLLGMVTGVVGGDARFALNAYSSSMFYVITYVLTSAGAFGMLTLLARTGFESEEIKDLAGLNKRNPWYAALLMMMMFSMAGIPFFVGFFAKFSVLQAVVAAGYLWLAIAAVFFSLVGAFYYLRVVKVMYFDQPVEEARVVAPLGVKVLISANGLLVALLGVFPNGLMWLCAYTLSQSL